ncbi:conserved hypothetical protein [Paraburkholderia atlantica]|uniref:Uncharacterized protein n=1 Tax=Paraburkholderia atlantica TaxID=2654982 RepID=D5WA31_PARAM|nr:hypothetical protein [Paraburkholderia atlantica]ADG14253.1 conserved hypothetical protein [Paraburkholderia atlantica]
MSDLYNTQAAAEFLSRALPDDGDSAYWSGFLINNRRTDRSPIHRIPFSRVGKAALYSPEDLARYVEFEKARRLGTVKLTGRAAEALQAFGIGESGGSSTGRRLEIADVSLQIDEATREPFVRLVISEPMLVYRLELSQAQSLSERLLEAAKIGKRLAK